MMASAVETQTPCDFVGESWGNLSTRILTRHRQSGQWFPRSTTKLRPISLRLPDMKKRLRTTKVLIETERVVTFRNSERQQPGWCFACAAETQMASIAYAAREAGLSELAIYQLLDAQTLHFCEDADGRILVCLNSLRN